MLSYRFRLVDFILKIIEFNRNTTGRSDSSTYSWISNTSMWKLVINTKFNSGNFRSNQRWRGKNVLDIITWVLCMCPSFFLGILNFVSPLENNFLWYILFISPQTISWAVRAYRMYLSHIPVDVRLYQFYNIAWKWKMATGSSMVVNWHSSIAAGYLYKHPSFINDYLYILFANFFLFFGYAFYTFLFSHKCPLSFNT